MKTNQLIKQSFFHVFLLLLIYTIPFYLLGIYPNSITILIIFAAPIVHIVLIIIFYIYRKYNLFALPIAHLILVLLPFFLLLIPSFYEEYIRPNGEMSRVIGDRLGVLLQMAIYIFIPACIITFIISTVICELGERNTK